MYEHRSIGLRTRGNHGLGRVGVRPVPVAYDVCTAKMNIFYINTYFYFVTHLRILLASFTRHCPSTRNGHHFCLAIISPSPARTPPHQYSNGCSLRASFCSRLSRSSGSASRGRPKSTDLGVCDVPG